MKTAARATSLAVAAIGTSGLGLVKSQSELIRINSRMADQLGITTESLTRLQHAITSTTEVSGEQFNEMLQEFNVRMGDVAVAGKGPLLDAFKELGLNFEEIKKLNTHEAFLRVADSMQRLGDKARVAFLAEEIFAGEAAKATDLLVKGRKAIEEYGDEAERLGKVLSEEESEKVLKMAENFRKLSDSIRTMGIEISAFIADYANPFLKFLTEVTNKVREMPSNLTKIFDFSSANMEINQLNQKVAKYIGYLKTGQGVDKRGRIFTLSEEDKKGTREHIEYLMGKIDEVKQTRNKILEPVEIIVEKSGSVFGQDKDQNPTSLIKEKKKPMIDELAELVKVARERAEAFNEIWGGAFAQFEQGIGDAVGAAIIQQESLGKGLQAVMRQVSQSVISGLVQIGVQMITQRVKAKALTSAANSALIGELVAIQAAATPAAIATNIATAGGAGVSAASSAAAAASATAAAISLKGILHDGIDFVPQTGTYLLEKGERVIPKKENKAGMGAVVNININAIDTQSATEVIMQNEPQIVEMIQNAYDSRGETGGPMR